MGLFIKWLLIAWFPRSNEKCHFVTSTFVSPEKELVKIAKFGLFSIRSQLMSRETFCINGATRLIFRKIYRVFHHRQNFKIQVFIKIII